MVTCSRPGTGLDHTGPVQRAFWTLIPIYIYMVCRYPDRPAGYAHEGELHPRVMTRGHPRPPPIVET